MQTLRGRRCVQRLYGTGAVIYSRYVQPDTATADRPSSPQPPALLRPLPKQDAATAPAVACAHRRGPARAGAAAGNPRQVHTERERGADGAGADPSGAGGSPARLRGAGAARHAAGHEEAGLRLLPQPRGARREQGARALRRPAPGRRLRRGRRQALGPPARCLPEGQDGRGRLAEPVVPDLLLHAAQRRGVGHPHERTGVAAVPQGDRPQARPILRGGPAGVAPERRCREVPVLLRVLPL